MSAPQHADPGTAKGPGVSAAGDGSRDTSSPAAPGLRRLRTVAVALAGMIVAIAYGTLGARLGLGAPMVLLALGGLSLGLCGIALYRVVDPLLRPEQAARAEAAGAPARLRELEREKLLVLKAIREIEHDYQMRRINDADYKTMSERYRSRALRLIRDIDAGDDFRPLIEQELKTRLAAAEAAGSNASVPQSPGETDRPTAGAGCAGCGTINDGDAQFCKKCGKAIATAEKAEA